MSKKLGSLIKAARVAAGLTQLQLAKKVKKTQSEIGRYERGEAEPTQQVVKDIAKACGVTQKSLLDAMPKSKTGKTGKTSTTSKADKADKTSASGKTGKTGKTSKTDKTGKTTSSKTPATAKNSMRVTATEKRLVELYREADSDTKKQVLAILRGKDADNTLGIDDVLAGLIGAALGQR